MAHVTSLGNVGVAIGSLPSAGQNPDGQQPLVLCDPREELQDAPPVSCPQQILERLLDRMSDEVGADVEIAAEPAQHQPVREGQRRIGEDAEGNEERDDESE